MQFDSTINIGDVIMGAIALGLIPMCKLLISTLMELRDGLAEIRMIVLGSAADHSSGLIASVAELKKDHLKLRNWMVNICATNGTKIEDRT